MKKNMMEKDHFLLNQNSLDDDKLYSFYSGTIKKNKLLLTMNPIFLLLTCFFLFYGCSQDQNAGATTETTNGIALFIKDSSNQPLPLAKIALFDSSLSSPFATATSDSNGVVHFTLNDSIKDYFIEAIHGADSSAMAWEKFEGDSSLVQVLSSVEIKVAFNTQDTLLLPNSIYLKGTPYQVISSEDGFIFKRAPQGIFEVRTDNDISLGTFEINQSSSFTFNEDALRKTLLLEDFNDGNIQFKYADKLSASGWYFSSSDDGIWYANENIEWTDPTEEIEHPAQFISENAFEGMSISLHYSTGDSGMLVLGTHLGADSISYDFSDMKAVRLMVRGDAIFDVALESNRTVGDNHYPKVLWRDTASTEWTEYVFYPGNEIVLPEHQQYTWNEVKQEIGIFSIFINSGSFIEIDQIIIDGINEITLEKPIKISSDP